VFSFTNKRKINKKKEERQTKKEEREKRDVDEKRAKAEKDAHPLRCPLVPSPASSSSSASSAASSSSSAGPPILTPSSRALFDELMRFAVNVPGRSIEPKASSNGELHFADRANPKGASYTYFKSLYTKSSSIFMYDFNRVRVLPASLKGYTIQCAIYHFFPEKADYFLGVYIVSPGGVKKTLWFSPTPPNEDGECPENSAESLRFRAVYNDKKKKAAPSSSSSSSSASAASAAAPSTSVAAGGDVLVSGKPLSLSVISTTTQSTSTTTTTTTAQIVLPTPVPVAAKRPLAGQQTATDPEVQPSKRPRVDPARRIESIIIID